MKLLTNALVVVAILTSSRVNATPENDKIYGLRTIVPLVLNTEQDPVYAEFVEEELARYFRANPRFDFSNEGYVQLKESVKDLYLHDPGTPTADKIDWIKPQLQALNASGIEVALVAEVAPMGNTYRISLVMVSTNELEFTQVRDMYVDDKFNLKSFAAAIQEGMTEIEKEIPFDGSIVKRDGFRVVLDRAYPDLKPGQTVSTYTIERDKEGKVFLSATGLVQVIEAGEKLSFGKILVDKKPASVEAKQKFLFAGNENTRELAATSTLFNTKSIGTVDLSMGGNLVTLTNSAADGSGSNSSNQFFPGGQFHGEMWLTDKTFLDLSVKFAFGGVTSVGSSLNSSVSDIRGQVGYELVGSEGGLTPKVSVRAGYLRHSVNVDASADPLGFNSGDYSGLFIGGAAGFNITDQWSTTFEISGLLFPSFSESPTTSGATAKSIQGWDFGVRANYHFTDKIDIIARLDFQSFSAEFEGTGTRPVPMVSASQSNRALSFGVSYLF